MAAHVAFNRVGLVALTVCLGSAVQYLRKGKRKKAIRRILCTRQVLSDAEFKELFPPEQSEVSVLLRSLLSIYIDVDLKGLLPADRFTVELGMKDMDGASMLKFMMGVEQVFDIDLPSSSQCLKMTFGELVAVIQKKKNKAANTK